ncbi:MAG: hypothetical protein LBS83_01510 [Holosporales bacterium]|nr:hypothetical protein [Holosporales bacterium]
MGFGYMVFDEDRSTIRKGSSAEVMALLGNMLIALTAKLNISPSDFLFECARFTGRSIHFILEN